MKWKNIICAAIHEKKIIKILYFDGIWRTIEPHTYGTSLDDNYVVSAFRLKKDGFLQEGPDWRMYLDDKIINIEVTDATFTTRTGYSPTPKNFKKVICKI